MPRLARPLAAAALALLASAAAAGEPSWQPPPRFAALWLEGGVFVPAGLAGARPREQVALGLAIRPLSFASLVAEGGWVSRSLPGDVAGRSQLTSRGASLTVKLHHALGGWEPSVRGGVSLWSNELAVPLSASNATDAEKAGSTGLVLGAALDWLPTDAFAAGVEWRWEQASARFPRLAGRAGAADARIDLSGHALGLALRLYWP